jgi:hypothetical protein
MRSKQRKIHPVRAEQRNKPRPTICGRHFTPCMGIARMLEVRLNDGLKSLEGVTLPTTED